jgi:hypothetical protein
MIGKITLGTSFSGCISYCLEDKKQKQLQETIIKNRAEVIAFNQCFGSKKELIEQFNDVRNLNRKVQKPVMHIVLSLAPGERLEKAAMQQMADECAKQMGFDKNQYLTVSHIDTGHQHVHIVANRVGYDGKVVNDSNNYKKIADFSRTMEAKYSLKEVLSPPKYLTGEKRNIPRLDTRKEKLRHNVKECLSACKDYKQFENRMKQKGYQIEKGRGIAFTDEKKVKFKGSEVGYSLQKIEKILQLQQHLQEVKDNKIKNEERVKPNQENTVTYDLYKQYLKERKELVELEDNLSTTINILLRPEINQANLPTELLKEAKKKKKRQQHL